MFLNRPIWQPADMASGTIRYSCESATTRKGFAYALNATFPIKGVPNELAASIANSYSGFAARATGAFDKKAGITALLSLGFQEKSPGSESFIFPVAGNSPNTQSDSNEQALLIKNLVPSEPTFDEPVADEIPTESPVTDEPETTSKPGKKSAKAAAIDTIIGELEQIEQAKDFGDQEPGVASDVPEPEMPVESSSEGQESANTEASNPEASNPEASQ